MTDHEDESRIARDLPADAARAALRRGLIEARRRPTDPGRHAANEALVERLGTLLGDLAGEVVAIYWPIRGEPSLGALPERWSRAGARLALPVVDAPRTPLRFLEWSPGDPTVPGVWGIPRPAHERALRPTVLVLPCVGFTADGYRLGYGGGFYDRSLAVLDADGGPASRTVGVAWDEALLAAFEPLPTDRPLDAVVTPSSAFLRDRGPAR
ncbi:MAG: 5-formyltetrahydrofolate cyclo-ligase [Burkholderiales bacterium]|jgi:5,10-methenyltetrahydrofolate synthetase